MGHSRRARHPDRHPSAALDAPRRGDDVEEALRRLGAPMFSESSATYGQEVGKLMIPHDGHPSAFTAELIATRQDPNAGLPSGYECEVSCVDWYGNARPIFTGGRYLALMNSELVEGELADGKIREIRRIDLTAKPE